MQSQELREKFLKFFEARGHKIIPSSSLIPENDSTTLFTGSGMQPLVPYLMGKPHPKGKRLANIQKSFRAEDIEEIGDNRHTTLFEMLGNWSLGDYFKAEQLNWVFQFFVEELKLDPHQLYVSVFRGNETFGIPRDTESAALWKGIFQKYGIEAHDIDYPEQYGLQHGRIFYYDDKNWWSRSGVPEKMPVREIGGPDSEIFYDLGETLKRHENSPWKNLPCHINCDCGRFIEIGNSVFMEFVRTEKGFDPLPQKNVDFGGGLERISAIVQNKANVFETDLFASIIQKIEILSARQYKDNMKSFEIIADHLKAASFIMADDKKIPPSNVGRGYIARRLIRRAIDHGWQMGIQQKSWTQEIAKIVAHDYRAIYPELTKNLEFITSNLEQEEVKFNKALEGGAKNLQKLAKTKKQISGEEAFSIYESSGTPISVLTGMAKKYNVIIIDPEGFEKAFRRHQKISRASQEKKFGGHGIQGVKKAQAKEKITCLHTATHLLLQALRTILDENIRQMGSDVSPEKLRFDFSFPKKLTDEEIQKIETLVNQKIQEDLTVHYYETDYETAVRNGALGSFKDRYPEKVTVYEIGNFSKEICAGPHVKTTREIGQFKILKDEAIGQGIRRIRATVIKAELPAG